MITSVKYIIIAVIITGAIGVSKLLMGNCSLHNLNVCYNNIGDDGISVIVEQLQHITTLTTLLVVECGLSAKGTVVCVRYIANYVKSRHNIVYCQSQRYNCCGCRKYCIMGKFSTDAQSLKQDFHIYLFAISHRNTLTLHCPVIYSQSYFHVENITHQICKSFVP